MKIKTIEEQIRDLFFEIFGMEYNGQYLSTSDKLPLELDPHFRPQGYQNSTLDEIVYNMVTEGLKETEFKILNYNFKLDNYTMHHTNMQFVWLLEYNEVKYSVPILIKWNCCNNLIIEVGVIWELTSDDIFVLATEALVEYNYKFNYSKIYHNFTFTPIPDSILLVPGLQSNEITSMKELVRKTKGLKSNLSEV